MSEEDTVSLRCPLCRRFYLVAAEDAEDAGAIKCLRCGTPLERER